MLRLFACLLLTIVCLAEPVTIKRVVDGDTVITTSEIRVRLYCIDAPESAQLFGGRATEYLRLRLEGRTVNLNRKGVDRYGRVLGVLSDGANVNLEMISTGHAWVYTEYCREMTYHTAQGNAKQNLRGLWIQPSPVAPWEFRRGIQTPDPNQISTVIYTGPRGGKYYYSPKGKKVYIKR